MAWFGEFWIQSRLNREGISSFMGSCITSVTRYRQFAAPVTYWWCLERWVRKVTQLTQKVEFRFRKQRNKGKKKGNTRKITEVHDSDDNIFRFRNSKISQVEFRFDSQGTDEDFRYLLTGKPLGCYHVLHVECTDRDVGQTHMSIPNTYNLCEVFGVWLWKVSIRSELSVKLPQHYPLTAPSEISKSCDGGPLQSSTTNTNTTRFWGNVRMFMFIMFIMLLLLLLLLAMAVLFLFLFLHTGPTHRLFYFFVPQFTSTFALCHQ